MPSRSAFVLETKDSMVLFDTKSSSPETQGRSVGSGKTAGKVFKNGQERPWDTALHEPDLRILVLDWVQKNIFYAQSEARI